jgi:hypothetical protein
MLTEQKKMSLSKNDVKKKKHQGQMEKGTTSYGQH